MKYPFKIIQQLVNEQKTFEPLENGYFTVYNALTNKKACDKFLGVTSLDGTKNFANYSLRMFLYDLLEWIIPIENQLLKNGILKPQHYFYQKVKEKFQDDFFQHDFNILTSLMYAQNNACSHWNHSHLINKQDIDLLILSECSHNGMRNYELLCKIFNKNHFQTTTITYNNDPNLILNLNEYITTSLLMTNNLQKQKSLFNLSNELNNLDILIDFKKVQQIVNFSNINYFALNLIDNSNFNNSILNLSFNTKNNNCLYKVNTVDYVRSLHLIEAIEKFIDNKVAIGIDGKKYVDFKDLKNHIYSSHVMHILPTILEDKISIFKSNEKKLQWQHIKMDLMVPDVKESKIISKKKI